MFSGSSGEKTKKGEKTVENLGYYNGKIGLIDEISVPMNDRVSYFGDGVYDVTVCRNYTPYVFDDHIDRFYNSAALIKIDIPMSKKEIKELLLGLIRKVDSPDQMMYWQVTRGTAPRSHEFPADVKPNMWVMLKPFEPKDMSKTIKLITVEDMRYYLCNIKTLNLLPNCMAEQAAREAGCNTAVFHRGERVTECAHSNVHIIKDGRIITAPTDNLILPGIARKNMLRIAKKLGVETVDRPFTVKEMLEADEIFCTSSTAFCMRVSEIDHAPVGMKNAALMLSLQNALKEDFLSATDK